MAQNAPEHREFRFDLRMGEARAPRRTQQGGLAVDANLTRTGVLTYRMPDGSTRRELRHPDEVFHPDSLASFAHAPVTVDHPGRVGPDNYAKVNVGHVAGTPKREGKFATGTLHIQDGDAIKKVESGAAREVSCGYECRMDMTPGTFEGEDFDAQQKEIRGNHVAIGPKGWGRAGPEVALKLDGGVSAEDVEEGKVDAPEGAKEGGKPPPYVHGMNEEERKALEKATADAKAATEAVATLKADAADADAKAKKAIADAQAELVRVKTENDLLRLNLKQDKTAADKKREAEVEEEKITAAVAVRADAAKVFATIQDPKGARWKADGKTVPTIKQEILLALQPGMKATVDELDKMLKSDSVESNKAATIALDSVYTTALDMWMKSDAAVEALGRIAEGARADGDLARADGATDEDEDEPKDAAAERKKMDAKRRDAWKKTPPRMDRARQRDSNRDSKGAR